MAGRTQNAMAGTITYPFKYQNAKHYHSQLENNQNKITGGETNYFVWMSASGCVWIEKDNWHGTRVLTWKWIQLH